VAAPDNEDTLDTSSDKRPSISAFSRNVLLAVGIAAAIVLLVLLVISTYNAFLLLFSGIMVALFFRGIADWIKKYIRIPHKVSVVVTLLLLIGAIGFFAFFTSARLISQFSSLSDELTHAIQQLQDSMRESAFGRTVLHAVPPPEQIFKSTASFLGQAAGIFSTAIGVIAGLGIMLFIGFYLALTPELYVNGILRLVPIHKRDHARHVMLAVAYVLRWWIIGRIFSMVTLGIMTGVGLWALGIPLPLALGVLVAVLTFIPYIGAILAFIPILVLALAQSLSQGLYVLILYLGIQFIESYLLTPFVEKKAVSLPPSLTLFVQVITGALMGIFGIILASPITAVAMVLIRILYIKDILGEEVTETTTKEADEKIKRQDESDERDKKD
jgi:predicted PurR-regulated permease PerM